MYSLHLTGNPWFLLLILPGAWILWRQYRGGSGGRGRDSRGGWILFGLQAAAMALLAASLTAPELRRHHVEFHNPAILILRDQSSSFRGGGYLGLGGAYAAFAQRLTDAYGSRKFDVRVADFAERAWPVSGFARAERAGGAGAAGLGMAPKDGAADDAALTSLASAGDFIDSAAIPNLQAVFLFSDGRANLDSGRASRTWRVPLFPVILPIDSISEAQPERVRLSLNPDGAAAPADLEVVWRAVGKSAEGPELRLLQGGRTLLTKRLPAAVQEEAAFRFSWKAEKAALENREPIRAALMPFGEGRNTDPYNDTVAVASSHGRGERIIHVYRPVRSLDEKGMIGILQAWEGAGVSFFGGEDLGGLNGLKARDGDQVWVEAGSLGAGRLSAWLRETGARVVVYARREPGRILQVTGADRRPWQRFSALAEIKPGKAAAEAFPDEAVRLKSLADSPLELPEAGDDALVEVREGGKRGMLMGRIALGEGKRALFLALPAVWGPLFDPQGDFATRENIAAYVKAAYRLAELEDGTARVSLPDRAWHRVPFDADVRLPDRAAAASKGGGPAALSAEAIDGSSFSQTWTAPAPGGGDGSGFRVRGISLPRGKYRLELRAGGEALWRDSLMVLPKAALELARIGFDRAALEDAASRSGGRVVGDAGPAASGAAEVASGLPSGPLSGLPALPGAQIRMERTTAIRLYNTLAQCLLILAFLSLSWFLRKKWDID
jgi:hypothetical protein